MTGKQRHEMEKLHMGSGSLYIPWHFFEFWGGVVSVGSIAQVESWKL